VDFCLFPAVTFKLISEKIYGDSFEVYNLSPISKMPRDIIPYVPLPKLEEIIHGK